MFTICIFGPKDLKYSEIPILQMGKPFGTSGIHFPTLVKVCLSIGSFFWLAPFRVH